MNATDKILLLMSKCKASIDISINDHKSYYEGVKDYFSTTDIGDGDGDEFSVEILQQMIDADSIVRIQFYPRTPVGFYTVHRSNLIDALDECLSILED